MKKYFSLIVALYFTSANAQDECRDPSVAEKTAVQKVVDAGRNLIREVAEKNGWVVESEGNDEKIASHPGPFRPLMVCGFIYTLRLAVDPASSLGQDLKDSTEYYQKLSQNQEDVKKLAYATKQMFHFAALGKMEIIVIENNPYLHQDPLTSLVKIVIVPGAAFAYSALTSASSDLDEAAFEIHLCFGKWADASKYLKTHSYVAFPFEHKTSGGFIENIEVTFKGDSGLANDLIKKIDWNKMNEALTH